MSGVYRYVNQMSTQEFDQLLVVLHHSLLSNVSGLVTSHEVFHLLLIDTFSISEVSRMLNNNDVD